MRLIGAVVAAVILAFATVGTAGSTGSVEPAAPSVENVAVAPYPCGTVHWPDGRETQFCVGEDHRIYWRERRDSGEPWGPWHDMGGYATSGVTVNGDRTWHPQIVVRGADYVTYWERHWDGARWTEWARY
ncbi:hypothetical protein [Amycolatopsis anabasis]|uniref:hypothetical protein n=1 Tax=Amycolatopsis anabasis TaxID=1840409 RepID=UPI00131DA76E|nr:hypothetical protein [Amycolatopsis anabasis]